MAHRGAAAAALDEAKATSPMFGRDVVLVDHGRDDDTREVAHLHGTLGRGVTLDRQRPLVARELEGDRTVATREHTAQFAHRDTNVVDLLVVEAGPARGVSGGEAGKP